MRRVLIPALLVLVVALAACSSSSKSSSGNGGNSSNNNGNSGKNFDVQTPEGTVSLSLNGQLPPGWPSSFPVPNDSTPAGSGSLANNNSGVMIAVYTTKTSPTDAYNFYKSTSGLTFSSSGSVGSGDKFVGTLVLSGSYGGNIVILARNGTTNIVITLTGGSGTTTTSAATTATT
jgi:hypothetical protein